MNENHNQTEQELAKSAAEHSYFTKSGIAFDDDKGKYWRQRAEKFLEVYTGDFPFVLDIRKQYNSGKPLSTGQIAGILNVARKLGQELNKNNGQEAELTQEQVDSQFESITLELELPAPVEQAKQDGDISPTYLNALEEITTKIKEIQAALESLVTLTDPLDLAINESKKEESDLIAEVQRKITELREKRAVAEIEKVKIAQEIKLLQEQLEKLRREHALTIQQIAADKKFSELLKKFSEIRDSQPWGDSIKPFQWNDVCFMAAAFMEGKTGVLNANDMGLGKTFESAALISILIPLFVEQYNRKPRMLWLTKKSLRNSSFREIHKWIPDQMAVVVDGQPDTREFLIDVAVASNALVICNYDMLNSTPKLVDYEWDFVFADEVHKLKGGANPQGATLVWQNTKTVVEKAKFFVPLSGSPIQNHPREMWSYLHLFAPDRFPNAKRFEREYCYGYGEVDEKTGKPILNVSWDRIIKVMSDRVIRHSKAEVLTELPDKTREFRYVELTGKQREVYMQLRDEFFVWLDEQKTQGLSATSILAQLTRLRQAAILPASMQIKSLSAAGIETTKRVEVWDSAKIEEAMDIIEELLANNEQVVVYSSQFNEPLFHMERLVTKKFGVTTEVLSGKNSSQVDAIEQRFQKGETKVLLVNMKTGGEGLNLQKSDEWAGGANHVIMLDLWWNPKFNEQAEDRVHRVGQKDAVTIHIIQAEDTVDAFIAAKIEEKEQMISGIMEDDTYRKSADDWKQFLMDKI